MAHWRALTPPPVVAAARSPLPPQRASLSSASLSPMRHSLGAGPLVAPGYARTSITPPRGPTRHVSSPMASRSEIGMMPNTSFVAPPLTPPPAQLRVMPPAQSSTSSAGHSLSAAALATPSFVAGPPASGANAATTWHTAVANQPVTQPPSPMLPSGGTSTPTTIGTARGNLLHSALGAGPLIRTPMRSAANSRNQSPMADHGNSAVVPANPFAGSSTRPHSGRPSVGASSVTTILPFTEVASPEKPGTDKDSNSGGGSATMPIAGGREREPDSGVRTASAAGAAAGLALNQRVTDMLQRLQQRQQSPAPPHALHASQPSQPAVALACSGGSRPVDSGRPGMLTQYLHRASLQSKPSVGMPQQAPAVWRQASGSYVAVAPPSPLASSVEQQPTQTLVGSPPGCGEGRPLAITPSGAASCAAPCAPPALTGESVAQAAHAAQQAQAQAQARNGSAPQRLFELEAARGELARLRAENAALRASQASREQSHSRLKMENRDLWDQVAKYRQKMDDLSQQLRQVREVVGSATSPGGSAAAASASVDVAGDGAQCRDGVAAFGAARLPTNPSTALGSSPAQSLGLSEPETPPSPASLFAARAGAAAWPSDEAEAGGGSCIHSCGGSMCADVAEAVVPYGAATEWDSALLTSYGTPADVVAATREVLSGGTSALSETQEQFALHMAEKEKSQAEQQSLLRQLQQRLGMYPAETQEQAEICQVQQPHLDCDRPPATFGVSDHDACSSGSDGERLPSHGQVGSAGESTRDSADNSADGSAGNSTSAKAASPAPGGAESALTRQLAQLKAHMAAVEAQGASLRSATRAVEEEYRRVVARTKENAPSLGASS
eukprot:TRINITY_DN6173_c0_g2_i2.p1 TRINITY_DN6173_c0_g2~~TRINITY_DN6173_c0_g2_i2.p1  ORF type:complete len:859 (-),score=153.56 TRINITY_DN6173_c0_g2_i2:163-2688(-)